MSIEEFSTEFDVLLNSYPLDGVDKLICDEYEKSVYLTEAQRNLVISYFTNNAGGTFEKTEEIKKYLVSLVKTYTKEDSTTGSGISPDSVFFDLPSDYMFIIYEAAVLTDATLGCLSPYTANIIPITHDYYYKASNNPFKAPNYRRVFRIDSYESKVELVSKYHISSYFCRYIKNMIPIILTPLDGGLSIEGYTQATTCLLHPALHRAILELAVSTAFAAKVKLHQATKQR